MGRVLWTRRQMRESARALRTRGLAKAERIVRQAAARYGRVGKGEEWGIKGCTFCTAYPFYSTCFTICPVTNPCGTSVGYYAIAARYDRRKARVVERWLLRYADIIAAELLRRREEKTSHRGGAVAV